MQTAAATTNGSGNAYNPSLHGLVLEIGWFFNQGLYSQRFLEFFLELHLSAYKIH